MVAVTLDLVGCFRAVMVCGGALIALAGAACSNNAILDQSPLGSFVVVRVTNDTSRTVDATGCWDRHCRNRDTGIPTVSIRPGHHRDEAYWNNSDPGVGAVRFVSAASAPGC